MKVVVIGGGVGGLACVRQLSKTGGGLVEITLIDRSPNHDFAPSFLWLLNATRDARQISRPIKSVADWGVNFVQADVTSIDLGARTVMTTDRPVEFDELVIAPGAELDFELVPGLSDASSFYTKDAALSLASKLHQFGGGRVQLVIPAMPYKCPAAPYEAALLIDDFLRRRGVKAEIGLHTVEPQPMPVAGPAIGQRVASILSKRGINFKPNRTLGEVDSAAQRLRFEGDGEEAFDLLITIPPHQAPTFVCNSDLAGSKGWIPVDPKTLQAADHVHAIGDVTSIQLSNGKPLPKAGVFAHGQAHVVADNLLAIAQGRRGDAEFAGHGSCFLETGSGKAGVARGKFYAQPDPQVRMFPPSRLGHLAKVLFERKWLGQLNQSANS